MIQQHIKIAIRNLISAKLFTGLNVLGLTGGMVAGVFILLWVQNELSFDQYHRKAARIHRIITHLAVSKQETWHWATAPLPLAEQVKTLPEIEKVARMNSWKELPMIVNGQKITAENAAYVDPAWFDLFDYQFISGSPKSFAAGTRNIAMTESTAKKLFGTTNIAGKTIRIDSLDYAVAGVYRDNPANSSFQYDYILPLAAYLANPETFKNENTWNNFNFQTYVLARPQTDLKKLGSKLTSIISTFKKNDDGSGSDNTTLEVEPLEAMHFNGQIQGTDKSKGDRKTIYIFLGLGIVIVVVACINYVNLTTARASVRAREVSVKKLLGASHSSLFTQFMIESVITCAGALLLSFALIILLAPAFKNITEQNFNVSLTNPTLWLILLGTVFLAILLTGIYPSVLLSSFKPFETLRGANVAGTSSAGFRKGLVVVQFSVAIIFLISMLVVQGQMKYIREKELGYDRSHTFTFRLPWEMRSKIDPQVVKAELLRDASVADVTIASQSIVQIGSSTSGSYDWDGRPKDFAPTVSQIAVEDNFAKMFDLKLVQGRWFDATRPADKTNVILNETAAKKLNLRKPIIGQRFDFQGMKGNVIGIVKDFHFKSMREKIEPLVLFNNTSWSLGLYVKAQPGKDAEAVKAATKIWDRLVPNSAIRYTFLDETFDRLYKNDARTASLFSIFTAVALMISCLGLFGLATFTAERRVKEIGLRKVLGASVAGIVSLLSKDFLLLVLISIVVASPIAYYAMDKWLQGFEYRIEITWITFMIAAFFSFLIGFLTISYQSIKTALTNPVKSLRSE